MPTLVTFKLDENFLKEVDSVSQKAGFSNRTDFIRNTLREKIDNIRYREAYIRLSKLRKPTGRKITDEDLHKTRIKAFNELMKEKEIK